MSGQSQCLLGIVHLRKASTLWIGAFFLHFRAVFVPTPRPAADSYSRSSLRSRLDRGDSIIFNIATPIWSTENLPLWSRGTS